MQGAAARGVLALLLAIVMAALAPSAARAQALSATAVERWIDGLLAEMRSAGAARAERGAVTIDKIGGFAIAGVTVEWTGASQLSIDRLAGESVTLGARFNARQLRAEGLVFSYDVWRFEASRIELAGLDMPTRGPAELFGRGDTGLAATVRELNLARASIPSLIIRAVQGQFHYRFEASDWAATEVVRGIARRVGIARMVLTASEPAGPPILTAALGATTLETVDLTLEAEAIAPPPSAARERRTAYARVVTEDGTLDAGGGRLTLGRIEFVNVRSRAPRASYGEMWRLNAEVEAQPGGVPTPEQRTGFMAMLQDILDLGEVERMSVGASRIEAPGTTVTLGGIVADDVGPARFARLALSDLRIQSPDGSHALGSFTLREVDYARALLALIDIGIDAEAGGSPDPARLEGHLPRLGAIELRGLAITVPTPDGPRPLSLGGVDFSLGRWRGLVPDRVRLAVADLRIPAALLREAGNVLPPPRPGREWIDVGSEIEVRVDAAVRTATLRPARITAQGLGALDVELTFGDVDASRFDVAGLSDPAQLLEQATFRELRLRVENAGLIQGLFAAGRLSENEIRQSILPVAQQLLGGFVQDSAQAERARAALDAFARERRSLTLVVTPRGRLSASELVAALQGGGAPLQLLGQVNLELSAND